MSSAAKQGVHQVDAIEARSGPPPSEGSHTIPEASPRLDSGAFGPEMSRVVTAWTHKTVWILRDRFLGLSIRDFARALGVSSSLVGKWEKGGAVISPAHARLLELVKRGSSRVVAHSPAFREAVGRHYRGDRMWAFLLLINEVGPNDPIPGEEE